MKLLDQTEPLIFFFFLGKNFIIEYSPAQGQCLPHTCATHYLWLDPYRFVCLGEGISLQHLTSLGQVSAQATGQG